MNSDTDSTTLHVRLARQDELAAIDAVLGSVDWTRRDAVGVLVSDGVPETLAAAAVLSVWQSAPAATSLRMKYRFVEGMSDERRFAALIDFALAASARAAVSRLAIEHVADEPHTAPALQRRGFRAVAAALHFEGDTATAKRVTADLAQRAAVRFPHLSVLPLASCSPAELTALAVSGIGLLGLGVRALQAGDEDVLASFTASYAAYVEGKLRGAIVAGTAREPAFIEMLVVEPRYSRHGLATVLIDRCAEALLAAGSRAFTFSTDRTNRSMRRLAERLQCRATPGTEVWEALLGDRRDTRA